jgi:hypothetical protein
MAKKEQPSGTLQLGPVTVPPAGADKAERAAIMLWGAAGCGKSTFAATGRGNKLWLSLGDNEHVSIMHRSDVRVAKLYDLELDDLFKHMQNDNPLGLDQALSQDESIGTVVMDSVTALSFRALQKAVKMGVGASRTFKPTMEAPGIGAYGARNAICLEVLTGLLRVTAKHGVDCILTAHEGDPVVKQENNTEVIDYIGVMLGGQLVNNTTWRLSEIWYMSQQETGEKNRRIMIRPTRKRKPAKTRMFVGNDKPEFDVSYDPFKPDDSKGQMTIAKWVNEWLDGGGKHLPIPVIAK